MKKRTATISNFLHLFTFHQCNEEVFIQHTKNNKFKNRKENLSIEAQSEGHTLIDKISESHLAD